MSFYHVKMHQTLRSISISTASIIQDEVGAGRFESPPILDMWKIVYNTILFKVYAKLVKDLPKQWDKLGMDSSPVDGPDGTWNAYGSGEMIPFGSWIQLEWPGIYAPMGRPAIFDSTGARRSDEFLTKEYFELWSGESWMLNDSLNADGITQDQQDRSQAGPLGLLSVDTEVLNDLIREAEGLTRINQGERTPQQDWTIETGNVLKTRRWYSVYEYVITGRGWRDQQYTPTLAEQLKTFVYDKQQQEILKVYGDTEFFNMEQQDSSVFVGVDNNANLQVQTYTKNFLVKAEIDWGSNTVVAVEAGGVNKLTEEAINT